MKVYRYAYMFDNRPIPYGPYCGHGSQSILSLTNDMEDAHCFNDKDWPTPYNDGLGSPRGGEFCGFTRLNRLRIWFAGFHRRLAEVGFRVHVYEVPDEYVRHGRVQCLAKLGKGKLIKRYALVDTFTLGGQSVSFGARSSGSQGYRGSDPGCLADIQGSWSQIPA